MRLNSKLWRLKAVGCIIVDSWLSSCARVWRLLRLGPVKAAGQLDTDLGGGNLALLPGHRLLLQQLGLDLLLDLSQLLLLQLNSL